MKRGSSTRLIGSPRTSMAISLLLALRGRGRGGACCASAGARGCRRTVPHRLGGRTDGGHDVLITGAAAVVALDGVPDLVVGWIGVVGQQVGRGHDHPR